MSSAKKVLIYNVNVVTPARTIVNGWIRLADGAIEATGDGGGEKWSEESMQRMGCLNEDLPMHAEDGLKLNENPRPQVDHQLVLSDKENPPIEAMEGNTNVAIEVINGHNGWVVPGFIDVHVHGGYGHDFMEADAAGLDDITRFHGMHGTSCMLATTVTAPKADIDMVLQRVQHYREGRMLYAQLLGVHLEGPFISPKWPGAQNPLHIVPPQPAWLDDWTRRFPGLIRMQTLAPEIEGAPAYIEALIDKGIVAALGHTDATYEQVLLAARHGLSHAVHAFNAMRGLHHREPGTVGGVMSCPAIMAEVIADGHHVHPACISLLVQAKGPDNMLLITDAIAAAGLGDGSYQLGGLDVVVTDGVARLREGGSLAGSTLTMIEAFRYAVRHAGISVEHASRMASGNPARRLGVDDVTGALQPGKRADVLLLDQQLELQRVWIQGRAIR